MKTTFKRIMFALAALITIAPVGCSKDDADKQGNDIEGTTWVVSYVHSEDGETWELGESFTFLAGGRGTYTYFEKRLDAPGNFTYTRNGSYVYNAPTVTFKTDPEGGYEGWAYTGTINGDKMAVYMDGEFYEMFTKQK